MLKLRIKGKLLNSLTWIMILVAMQQMEEMPLISLISSLKGKHTIQYEFILQILLEEQIWNA